MKGFLIAACWLLGRVWIAMLLIGSIHHDVWPPLPAFGWWETLAIIVLADVLFSGAVSDGLAHHKAVNE